MPADEKSRFVLPFNSLLRPFYVIKGDHGYVICGQTDMRHHDKQGLSMSKVLSSPDYSAMGDNKKKKKSHRRHRSRSRSRDSHDSHRRRRSRSSSRESRESRHTKHKSRRRRSRSRSDSRSRSRKHHRRSRDRRSRSRDRRSRSRDRSSGRRRRSRDGSRSRSRSGSAISHLSAASGVTRDTSTVNPVAALAEKNKLKLQQALQAAQAAEKKLRQAQQPEVAVAMTTPAEARARAQEIEQVDSGKFQQSSFVSVKTEVKQEPGGGLSMSENWHDSAIFGTKAGQVEKHPYYSSLKARDTNLWHPALFEERSVRMKRWREFLKGHRTRLLAAD